MADPRIAFVVSHTHWDREWYLTFPRFRTRLVEVVRRALDALEGDPAFEHFVLDGQSIVIEDHLAARPEDEERIRRLAGAGALSLGPWYVLPDEFLVSAEALVRNLLVGHRVAARFGPVQKVGYLPDSFGHVAQMPQILRRSGIDSFVYTRGDGDEIERLGHEHLWEAPDGSEVLAIQQCDGYCGAAALGHEELEHARTIREVDPALAVAQVRRVFERTSRLARGDVYLVSNGCDHLPPQARLGEILAALREAFPGTEFRHASLAEYVEEVRRSGCARERHRGDRLGGRHQLIISGVWSARMPLKQENDRAQTLVERMWEPTASYARFVHGREYPQGLLDLSWKRLLQNHPHDSICGCSTDEVHLDMEPRFREVVETAEQAVSDTLASLVPTRGARPEDDRDVALCVMNPMPERRREVLERTVVLEPGGLDPERIALVDDAGRPVEFEVLDRRLVERFWSVDYRTELFGERQREHLDACRREHGSRFLDDGRDATGHDRFLTVRLLADLPPLGHSVYRLVEGEPSPPPDRVAVSGDTIENGRLRVTLHPDGSLDVIDMESGEEFAGLNRYEDSEDVGDEYDHSPAVRPETITSEGASGEAWIEADGGLAGRLAVEYELMLPASIAPGRERRSEGRVPCLVRTVVGLAAESPVVDVRTTFLNLARDHRLRVGFPAGVGTDTLVTDGHFLVSERPFARPTGEDWVQPAPETWPQRDFSLVSDGRRGLAVLVRGLPELAPIPGGFAVTLLRSVGWLSRDDLPTRRGRGAGPTLPTPRAQCLGEHRFRYAVVPFSGPWRDAGIKAISDRWRTPVPVVQGVAAGHVPGGEGLLEKETDRTAVSAVKRHSERDTLVVRLVNLTGREVAETLRLGFDAEAVWRTDLLEERIERIGAGREIRLDLGPHEIGTVEIEPAVRPRDGSAPIAST